MFDHTKNTRLLGLAAPACGFSYAMCRAQGFDLELPQCKPSGPWPPCFRGYERTDFVQIYVLQLTVDRGIPQPKKGRHEPETKHHSEHTQIHAETNYEAAKTIQIPVMFL